MRLSEVIDLLGSDVRITTDGNFEVREPVSLGQKGDVAFATSSIAVKRAEHLPRLLLMNARSNRDESILEDVEAVIFCDNPRLAFAKVLSALFPQVPFVHRSAVLYPCVQLGKRVTIHANAVLGADGFGFERDENGVPVKIPQLGGVVIGDDVEIGAGTCVDRGALTDTVIGNDVKLDNNVHIAHGVTIGDNTMIAASAMVAGSTRIGKGVWVGPSAVISNGLKIGDGASVRIGALVLRDVEPGGDVR